MALSIWEALAVFAAGTAAGTINTIVGSGTLITFPVLLATGMPPVTATVSNGLGLIPGSISGAIGYRAELTGQRSRILRLGLAALIGGLSGAMLLLLLPSTAFETVVPVLVALALVLVILQPRIARAVQRRRERNGSEAPHPDGGPLLFAAIMLASVYGGYFTAAQGIIYLSLMGMLLQDSLQRLNATKNVLAAIVNGVAALFFL
ncbi:sulfite exporter TauE/SafE family protein, partial [Streptomyces sp. NPDC054841]